MTTREGLHVAFGVSLGVLLGLLLCGGASHSQNLGFPDPFPPAFSTVDPNWGSNPYSRANPNWGGFPDHQNNPNWGGSRGPC